MAVRDPCQILERAATEGGTEQTEEQTSARSVVALVTGATGKGGIGYETARQLAKKLTRKGVHIVLAGSKELGEEDLVTFKNESLEPGQSEMSATDTGSESGQGEGSGTEESEPTVESMKLDLSSLASVKEFVKTFKEKYTHLNYLVHCDGVVFVGFEKTVDGFERHFQVNHLGPCLLTLELHPLLKMGRERKGGAQVVLLTSAAHSSAEFDPSNMNGEQYCRFMAYYNSMLYNVMFAYCLQRRFADDKISVRCVDPGKIKSNFINDACSNRPVLKAISKVILKLCYQGLEVGAERMLKCTVADPSVWLDMQYFHQGEWDQLRVSSTARNVRSQKLLWERSMAAVREHMTEELANKFAGTEVEGSLLREMVDLRDEVKREKIAAEGDGLQEMAAMKLALRRGREERGERGEEPGAKLLLKMVGIKKSERDGGGNLEDLLTRAHQELREGGENVQAEGGGEEVQEEGRGEDGEETSSFRPRRETAV